jgi:hypothetical protein
MRCAREVICCAFLLAGQAVWAQIVCAQSIDVDTGRGHGFVSIGFTAGAGDAADERSHVDKAHGQWLVNGAVFVAKGLAVGVETMPEHHADDRTTATITFSVTDTLSERAVVFGTLRARAGVRPHFAVDGVFGIGALRQHRELTTTSRIGSQTTYETVSSDATNPAVFIGIDGPLVIARHLAFTPLVRLYHLSRSGVPGREDAPQFRTSSWRLAMAVTAGFAW